MDGEKQLIRDLVGSIIHKFGTDYCVNVGELNDWLEAIKRRNGIATKSTEPVPRDRFECIARYNQHTTKTTKIK